MAVEQRRRASPGTASSVRAGNGFKVGPLFADDAGCAEALFHGAGDARSGRRRDIPRRARSPTPRAIALAERHGMSPVFETARMYAGLAPKLPLAKLFGVTTFELG